MFKSILLPIDLNHPSSWEKALPLALEMAANGKAELHLLTIVHDLGSSLVASFLPEGFEQKALMTARESLEAFARTHLPPDVRARLHVGYGHVPETILGKAEETGAEVIVMASHPPDDLRDFVIGSNANKVVRHAPVSVLVVR